MITVYVDVLFLINFSVDYIVLVLTGRIFHLHTRRWRELLASFLLSAYALWALLLCGSYALLILSAIAAATLTCLFVFPVRAFLPYIKCVFVFSGLACLMGGVVEVLFRIVRYFIRDLSGERDGRQVIVFALLALASGGMIYIGNRLLDRGRGVDHIHVNIKLLQRSYQADLMVDTGNLVCEPLSGRRVIFLSQRYVERAGLDRYINNNEEFLKIKRIICIETANGKRAIAAYLCDEIKLPNKVVSGAIAVMQDRGRECGDGLFPSALL